MRRVPGFIEGEVISGHAHQSCVPLFYLLVIGWASLP